MTEKDCEQLLKLYPFILYDMTTGTFAILIKDVSVLLVPMCTGEKNHEGAADTPNQV